MTLPLWDTENPLRRIKYAYVNAGLISANILIFFILQSGLVLSEGLGDTVAILFGVTPAQITGIGTGASASFPAPITLVTHMFLHTNAMHLLGNMLFLWVCGDNVEDALGHLRYVLFYFLCGIISALVQVFANQTSTEPMIGASGAIAGVLGGYLVLYPRVKMWCLMFGQFPMKVQTNWALGSWAATQVLSAFAAPTAAVGWGAHIGGFICGILLIYAMRPRSAVVLQPPITTPVTPPSPDG